MSSTKNNGSSVGDPERSYSYSSNKDYALSGKIMLSAIVILFTVVICFVCLHIYARWYLLRARRRLRARRNRRRATHIVFTYDPSAASANPVLVPSQGLEETVLKSLPTFVYSSAVHGGGMPECAVCLSEFEEEEKGRVLPKCKHSFHIDCIDMWFQSHSTCPLCRTLVSYEIPTPAETPVEVALSVDESESAPSDGLCSSCRHDTDEVGSSSASPSSSSQPSSSSSPSPADSSSLKTRRKTLEAVAISIEVPKRNESYRGLVDEEALCLGSAGSQRLKSPGGQQVLRSPGNRILSLKRILSRDWRGSLSPSSPATGLSCSSGAEIDLERGGEQRVEVELQQ